MNQKIFFKNFEFLADTPNSVNKLRKLILHLAVQGKLVPQFSSDEPTKLIHQHISYTLPHGWLMCKLGDVLDVQNGYAFKSELFRESSEGIPLIRIRNLKKSTTEIYYIGEYSEEFLVNRDDYLIGMDGDFEIHKWNGPVGLLNQRICRLRNFSQYIEPEYIRYLITEKLDEIHANTSFVTVKHLSSRQIKAIYLPIPPLKEQKRIVTKVDQLMALCDQLEARQQKKHEQRISLNNAALDKLLTAPTSEEFAQHWQRICDNFDLLYDAPETVGQLRQAILQLAVQGKLVPQDSGDEPAFVLIERIATKKKSLINENKLKKNKLFQHIYLDESPYELPNGWEWVRLGNICLNITDGFHNTPKPTTSGIPYLTAKHIKPDFLDFDNCLYVSEKDHKELVRKTRPAKGDILVVNIGAGCGTPAIIEVEFEFSFKNVAILNRTKEINSHYLYYYLLLERSAIYEQLTKGGAQPFLSLRNIRNIVFPLPPLIEQKRIVAKVDQLMALCDELEAGLAQAQTEGGKLMEAVVHHVLAG